MSSMDAPRGDAMTSIEKKIIAVLAELPPLQPNQAYEKCSVERKDNKIILTVTLKITS